MPLCSFVLKVDHLSSDSVVYPSATWVCSLSLQAWPWGPDGRSSFQCRRAQTLICKKKKNCRCQLHRALDLWDVSSTAWFINFCPKLWKVWKTLFRPPTKQEVFQALSCPLSLAFPSLSLPIPFSLSPCLHPFLSLLLAPNICLTRKQERTKTN